MTRTLFRCIANGLVILMIVLPPFWSVAEAQSKPNSIRSDDEVIEDAEGIAVAQVEISESEVDGQPVIKATIAYGSRSTDVEVHGGDITFSGGYAIRMRDFGADASQSAIEISAESPDGRIETAVMRQNLATGVFSSDGLSDVQELLSESDALDLVNAGMPMITAIASDRMVQTHSLRPKPAGWVTCGAAFLVLVGAVIVVIAACGTPEPAQPLACWGAVVAAIGAATQAIEACNFPDRCQPPC